MCNSYRRRLSARSLFVEGDGACAGRFQGEMPDAVIIVAFKADGPAVDPEPVPGRPDESALVVLRVTVRPFQVQVPILQNNRKGDPERFASVRAGKLGEPFGEDLAQIEVGDLTGVGGRADIALVAENDDGEFKFGESQVIGSESHVAAAVAEGDKVAVDAMAQTGAVVDGVAAGGESGPRHDLGEVLKVRAVFYEVGIPPDEVLDGGEESARADPLHVAAVELAGTAGCRPVADHAVGHDHACVVVPVGGEHADGFKKVLVGVLAEGHAGYIFCEDGHQEIPAVAVQEVGTGVEVETLLASEHDQGVFVGRGVVQADIRKCKQVVDIAQAGGMVDDLAGVNRFFKNRKLRDVGPEVFLEVKQTLLRHHHERRSGELFGYGRNHEPGVGPDGNAVVQIGDAVAFGEDLLSMADNAYGTAGGVRTVVGKKDAVEVGFGYMAVIRAIGVAAVCCCEERL